MAPVEVVTEYFQQYVQVGEKVIVALSGGLDSVALLHACHRYLKQSEFSCFSLEALHIHHGLSQNADAWARFCVETAERLDVHCSVESVEVERYSRDGLEGAARRARHAVFGKFECDWIVLAHHRNDQAETVLFNLLRGCGLAGAAGMQSRNGKLLRPWLDVSRSQIVSYAEKHGLTWVNDESNADTHFSRNFLRQRTFPLLQSRFARGSDNLARASRHFGEARELLDELAQIDLDGAPAAFPLSLERVRQLSEPRARNLLRYIFRQQHIQIPGEGRLREVVRQLREAASDRHPQVSFGDVIVTCRKGWIVRLEKN